MPVMIQLRNVPDELHKKLKARAAEAGMSLSAYMLRDAQRLADRPTAEEIRSKLATLKPFRLKETPAQAIRAIRDGR
jgi:plasmid stability protein